MKRAIETRWPFCCYRETICPAGAWFIEQFPADSIAVFSLLLIFIADNYPCISQSVFSTLVAVSPSRAILSIAEKSEYRSNCVLIAAYFGYYSVV